ncbi:MAG TPA: hypothetical protein VIL70_09905, partial [Chthoniobacterales bacterium]
EVGASVDRSMVVFLFGRVGALRVGPEKRPLDPLKFADPYFVIDRALFFFGFLLPRTEKVRAGNPRDSVFLAVKDVRFAGVHITIVFVADRA